MKNCKNCGAEFTPKHETRGHEQLYCSLKCRSEAYKKRTNEKTNISGTTEDVYYRSNLEEQNNNFSRHGSNSNYDLYSMFKAIKNAEVEAIQYQLKTESLQKEIDVLKAKNFELQSIIDELEKDEDDDEENNDIISGLVNNFKKDPANTMNFAVSIINQLLKPKPDAKATTTA